MRIRNCALRLWGLPLVTLIVATTPTLLYSAPAPNSFIQHNLVSDIPGLASYTDPQLVNPWGVAFSGASPFWVADNGVGVATLYNTFGVKQGLVVTIPPAGASAPTGQVFNSTPDFGGSHFIFSTEDGTIAAWTSGTSAALTYTSPVGAIYKGLAIASDAGKNYLYATDFHNNAIDVLDAGFNKVSLGGSFTDPNLPAGYAPFGIQASGNRIYVTYALQDASKTDDVACPSCGFLNVFDTDGNLVQRLVSMGALNAPWGVTWAPSGFGPFSGDLLVGNFGDGTINVYDPTTGNWLAVLMDKNGNPIVNDGLWDLKFGNGGNGGFQNVLYFSAGINDEEDGLFGQIAAVPEPGTLTLLASGLVSLLGYGWSRAKQRA